MARPRKGKSGIDYNVKGFRELRNLPAARAELIRLAYEMQSSLGGDEYKVTDLVLEENRAAVSILATGKARMQNNKNHTLLKELIRRAQ